MKQEHIIYLVAALLFPLASAAQDKCVTQGQTEVLRIEREFAARRPVKGDQHAEQAWSKDLHAALKAVDKRVEECTRANKPKITPEKATEIEACLAEVRRRVDELQKRDSGRTLTLQEQTARRSEDQRLSDEYSACTKNARR